jgi:hypothetical protein
MIFLKNYKIKIKHQNLLKMHHKILQQHKTGKQIQLMDNLKL